MLTRAQLLAKGISEADADEILSSYEDSGSNPLESLRKALDGGEESALFKADDGDEDDEKEDGAKEGDDDDEGYDEEYMKKYMKKYMKSNPESAKKMAEEAGIFGEKMEKAASGIDIAADGAVIEMADLAPYLSAQQETISGMLKAMNVIAAKVETIQAQNAEAYSLLGKTARVNMVTAEALEKAMSVSTGRRGAVTADLEKARTSEVGTAQEIYQTLAKAMKNGNGLAGEVLSVFESLGKNVKALNKAQIQFIQQLKQEEK